MRTVLLALVGTLASLVIGFLGYVYWLIQVPDDAAAVYLADYVSEFVDAGNCEGAAQIGVIGLQQNVWHARSTWQWFEETLCPSEIEGSAALGAGRVLMNLAHEVEAEGIAPMNPAPEWDEEARDSDWRNAYDLSRFSSNPLFLLRNISFKCRCFDVAYDMNLTREIFLRRLLTRDVEGLDLVHGQWRSRIDGCIAAADRLADEGERMLTLTPDQTDDLRRELFEARIQNLRSWSAALSLLGESWPSISAISATNSRVGREVLGKAAV